MGWASEKIPILTYFLKSNRKNSLVGPPASWATSPMKVMLRPWTAIIEGWLLQGSFSITPDVLSANNHFLSIFWYESNMTLSFE